jgi:pyruvate-formate lyase-activating enzyme
LRVSLDLTLRLIESVNATPAGSTALIDVTGTHDVAVAQRWAEATGNTILTVHPGAVEILRGRMTDPIAALPPDRRPGYRLWLYTNFHCNLACDYCCVSSSPRAVPRIVSSEDTAELVRQATAAGVQELFITGGEPFMLIDLDERLRAALPHLPTTVLTNAMVWHGERRKRLEALPREGLTFQISLDSATAELHDRHRGAGSFDRATAGIRLAIELGFRVRVAATLGHDAGTAEIELIELFDSLDLEADQRVVRRVAQQGAANEGLTVSRASLVPEVCATADGVWWHPVAAADPGMQVSDSWSPLDEVIDAVRDEYRQHRIRGDVLASSFPCA